MLAVIVRQGGWPTFFPAVVGVAIAGSGEVRIRVSAATGPRFDVWPMNWDGGSGGLGAWMPWMPREFSRCCLFVL